MNSKDAESPALPRPPSGRSALAILLAVTPGASWGDAIADAIEQRTEAERATTGHLEEVLVTAEKRESRIQDTAISITAISGAELTAQGISDLIDVAEQTPGVSFMSAGPGQTQYAIRGLSSAGATLPTVGFYLDDVPLTPPSDAQNGKVVIDPDLYDLNRVEILRGPQGTLYGSGSMGGTIKLVTNQPDLRNTAANLKVDGSWTESGGMNRGVNGMLNIPIIEGTLSMRIVGTSRYTSGWIDRVVLNQFPLPTNPSPNCVPFFGCNRGNVLQSPPKEIFRDVNSENLNGMRGSLRYQVTDQLSATASAFHQRISQNGLSYFDNPPGIEAFYQPFNVPEQFSDTFDLYNSSISFTTPLFTLNAVTSYWDRAQSQTQDISETMQTLFGVPSFDVASGGVGAIPITEEDFSRQSSEEIRLTSTSGGAVEWVMGGFYSNYNFKQHEFSLASGLVPLFGSDNLFTDAINRTIIQRAVFGEVSTRRSSRFSATIGIRRYSYSSNGAITTSGIAAPTLTPSTSYLSASNAGVNPRATLSYKATQQILLYSTAAKGFRPGSGNVPIPVSGPASCLNSLLALGKTQAPSQYNPDTVWSYEIGEKASLLGERLSIDSAIYRERWSGVQQSITLGCGAGYTDNVGTASVWGGELELKSKLTSEWTLIQTGGYTHAVLTDTSPGTGLTAGQRLLDVPTYTASTSVEYNRPIGSYHLIGRLGEVLIGPSEDVSYVRNRRSGYALGRLRLGVAADRWSVGAYVNNIGNRHATLSNVRSYALNIPSVNRVATNQPRTFGLVCTLQY